MARTHCSLLVTLLFSLGLRASPEGRPPRPIVVGSKAFTEGHLLAELMAQQLESGGFSVERRFGMGGTGILFEALSSGAIDLYPEYTGTIARSLLETPYVGNNLDTLRRRIQAAGHEVTESFGFNNTYALAMKRERAQELGIATLSDLRRHPNLRVAFSHEFFNRPDGNLGLQRVYNLAFHHIASIEHALAYGAIDSGQIDITDIYSTDAKVKSLDLLVLEDDLSFFPQYLPVALARRQFKEDFPGAWALMKELEGSITTAQMIDMNSQVDIEKIPCRETVAKFLGSTHPPKADSLPSRVLQRAKEHLPPRYGRLGPLPFSWGFPWVFWPPTMSSWGVLSSTRQVWPRRFPPWPSCAFLFPLFGIGGLSALVALVLYGLLPIVINTYTGLTAIDKTYRDISRGLGLSRWESLVHTEIPMASPSIFAGVKTSVIIGIGTATLSALIGAGGHGVPIMARFGPQRHDHHP